MKTIIISILIILLIVGIYYFTANIDNKETTITLNINNEYKFNDLLITVESALRESTEPGPFDDEGSGSMGINIVIKLKINNKTEDLEFYLPAKPYTPENYSEEGRTKYFGDYKIIIIDTDESTVTIKLEKYYN